LYNSPGDVLKHEQILPAENLSVFPAASSMGMAAGIRFGSRLSEAGGFTLNVIAAMLVNLFGLVMLPRVHRAINQTN
jgi:hypothetical protein